MEILLGFDGSNASRAALYLAKRYAMAFKARVHVVTSLVGGSETSAEAVEEAERGLDSAREFLEQSAIPVEIHLLIRGLSPGEDLVEFAREHRIDLVVVGVKKTSKVDKMLFGSNARYVILQAPCPVLTVKQPESRRK